MRLYTTCKSLALILPALILAVVFLLSCPVHSYSGMCVYLTKYEDVEC